MKEIKNSIYALKIKIYQPQAHFRVPFSYRRRHTYPIPPYSTVLGLIANVLGIKNIPGQEEPCVSNNCRCLYHKLKQIKIGVCGNFETKVEEYFWLRNLKAESHIGRFGSVTNRNVGGHIEHIGGQMPCVTDVLNNVRIFIYLYHYDKYFLEIVKSSFENPINKTSVMHLGRAEDWILIEEIRYIDLIIHKINGNYKNFFWVPEKVFIINGNFDFKKVNGLAYNVTSFYKIQNGVRNFRYVKAKLNNGDFGDVVAYFDTEDNIPVFFTDLEEDKDE